MIAIFRHCRWFYKHRIAPILILAAAPLLLLAGCVSPVSYSISGQVLLADLAAPLAGVTMSFSNGQTPVFTDGSGHWAQTGLTGPVVVTPAKTGYGFAPPSRTAIGPSSSINFTAYETYDVSGTVTTGGMPLSGVRISFAGSATFTFVTTNAFGHWSKTGLFGPVTVSAALAGYNFSPGAGIALTGARSDVDFAATYAVSGQVAAGETGLAGVVIAFSDGSGNTTTDAGGHWNKTGLAGTVTVTPAKTGLTFTPAHLDVSAPRDDADFSVDGAYGVSGHVTTGGQPVAGAAINFGGGFATETTDSLGYWTADLAGTVEVTPVKTGYIFSPSSRTVTGADSSVDFAASYQVSGQITSGGNPVEGVTITFSEGFGTTTTDSSGHWSKSGLTGTSITATPSKNGYVFSPTNLSLSGYNTAADFACTYEAGGRVTADGAGVPDVTVSFSNTAGDGIISVTTDANGYWRKYGLYGTVTVRAIGYSPITRVISGPADNLDFSE